MALVRSEYAGELAVVAAWISALIPASVRFFRPSALPFDLLVVRYTYFQLQFLLDAPPNFETDTFLWIHEAHDASAGVSATLTVSAVAALALTLALALSVAYYLAEERVEDLPVDPVRAMGVLLGVCGLASAAATALTLENEPGITVPLAPVFMFVFAASLLRVDRD